MADIFNEQLIKVTISFRVEVFATLSRKNPPERHFVLCMCRAAELQNSHELRTKAESFKFSFY